eukprot:scaffold24308_cov122-Amphora_coffeaeformis.AAC.1
MIAHKEHVRFCVVLTIAKNSWLVWEITSLTTTRSSPPRPNTACDDVRAKKSSTPNQVLLILDLVSQK